jgi:uncharacterized protein (DUF1778 family)
MKTSEVICAKVKPDEARRIRDYAKRLGMTTSSFIRSTAVNAVKNSTPRRAAA